MIEQLVLNLVNAPKMMVRDGRQYAVVNATIIVPGVLPGSQGPLYYPVEEVSKDPSVWDDFPITVYHPTVAGRPVSASHPDVTKIGFLANTHFTNKLRTRLWFDVEKTKAFPEVWNNVRRGIAMELSTGLYTNNEPKAGTFNGVRYTHIARDYRPDHLAILPDQVGACSLKDGCGVTVNAWTDAARAASIEARKASAKTEKLSSLDKQDIGARSSQAAEKFSKQGANESAAFAHAFAASYHGARSEKSPEHAAAAEAHMKAMFANVVHGIDTSKLSSDQKSGLEATKDAVVSIIPRINRGMGFDKDNFAAVKTAASGENKTASELHTKVASSMGEKVASAHRMAAAIHHDLHEETKNVTTTNAWTDAARAASIAARKASGEAHKASKSEGLVHRENTEIALAKSSASDAEHYSKGGDSKAAGAGHADTAMWHKESSIMHPEVAKEHLAAASAHGDAAAANLAPAGKLSGDKASVHEASKEAFKASTLSEGSGKHEGSSAAHIDALKRSSEGDSKAASAKHSDAAEFHSKAAKTEDQPDRKATHEAAAKLHKMAAAIHHDLHEETKNVTTTNTWSDAAREASAAARKATASAAKASSKTEGFMAGSASRVHDNLKAVGEAITHPGHNIMAEAHKSLANSHSAAEQASPYLLDREAHYNAAQAHTKAAEAHEKAAGLKKGKRMTDNKDFSTDEERKAAFAHMAEGGHGSETRGAMEASRKANKSGKAGDHRAAAQAHRDAAEHHSEEGNTELAQGHRNEARSHSMKASKMTGNKDFSSDAERKAAFAHMADGDNGPETAKALKATRGAKTKSEHLDAAEAHRDAAAAHKEEGGPKELIAGHKDWAQHHEKMAAATKNSRQLAINKLVTNCKCEEKELAGLSDRTLARLAKNAEEEVENEDDTDGDCDPDDPDYDEEECGERNSRTRNRQEVPMTDEEYIAQAPPRVRAALQNAMKHETQVRRDLVSKLTANVRDPERRKRLASNYMKRTPEDLRDMLELLPRQANYSGASVAVDNANDDAGDDLLDIPTTNWSN